MLYRVAILFVVSFSTLPNIVLAKDTMSNQKEVCRLLKNEKGPVAYLLDKNGKVSRGPIDYGRYGYRYKEKDFYYIPTQYRMVISPARLKVISLHAGSWLELKEVTPVCRNSKTYEISYANQDWPQSATDRSWLPKKESAVAEDIEVEDPNSPYPVVLKYRFDFRIVGETYDATNK